MADEGAPDDEAVDTAFDDGAPDNAAFHDGAPGDDPFEDDPFEDDSFDDGGPGDEEGRAPICSACGVTALPSEVVEGFVCENPDCPATGEPVG